MSATWSLTYLKTKTSIRDVFSAVVDAFRAEVDDKLYDIESRGSAIVDVKASKAVVEEFSDTKRARIIVDSCQVEWYNRGVIVYPEQNGLFTLTDTVIHLGNIYESGRSRRVKLAQATAHKPDPYATSLFLFIAFLNRLTEMLDAQAVHIMFERNPAGRATGVHFHDRGQLVDDYYCEDIECEGHYGLIDLPEKPEQIKRLLDGRFGFLAEQPKLQQYDEEYPKESYFDGEDLSSRYHDPKWDVFNVR
ncbi:MAG: hypothetical protein JXB30_04630, partial [Anaerolineae bacterium]|nr:hypothetical protein [Anaerolineae bacterium]